MLEALVIAAVKLPYEELGKSITSSVKRSLILEASCGRNTIAEVTYSNTVNCVKVRT